MSWRSLSSSRARRTATLRPEDRDISEGRVTEFEARVWYDDRLLEPVLDVAAIRTSGALTQGWTVEYVKPLPKNVPPGGTAPMAAFQVKFSGTEPLQLAGREQVPLFYFRARAYLAPIDRSPLPCQMVPLNRPYVVVQEQPGTVRLTIPCVENLRLVRLTSGRVQPPAGCAASCTWDGCAALQHRRRRAGAAGALQCDGRARGSVGGCGAARRRV
jgi:hypothetical protein